MKPKFDATDISKFQQLLATPKHIVLLAHIAPDGDAVGSTLAFSRVLRKMGHTTQVIYPTVFPPSFHFISGAEEAIIAKEEPERAEAEVSNAGLIILMDLSEAYRVGALEQAVRHSSAPKVLIDHHLNPDDFTDIIFSYPTLSSTCLLTYHLIEALGLLSHIDKEVAEAIYVGMMTDTGFLTYNSNDPSIYTIISDLLERGIEKDKITSQLTRSYSISRLQLLAHLLHNHTTFYPQYKAAIITLSMSDKRKYDYQVGDTEGLVNEPLTAADISFSIFLQEMPHLTKVSLRSKGDFPTNEFAGRFFNGGGHTNASGAEIYMPLKEAEQLVIEALQLMHP